MEKGRRRKERTPDFTVRGFFIRIRSACFSSHIQNVIKNKIVVNKVIAFSKKNQKKQIVGLFLQREGQKNALQTGYPWPRREVPQPNHLAPRVPGRHRKKEKEKAVVAGRTGGGEVPQSNRQVLRYPKKPQSKKTGERKGKGWEVPGPSGNDLRHAEHANLPNSPGPGGEGNFRAAMEGGTKRRSPEEQDVPEFPGVGGWVDF